jgi:hypothetical protein
MKVKELVGKAEKDLMNEKQLRAVEEIKESLKNIASCERTLANLKIAHKELLTKDVDDFEEELDY